MSQNVDSTALAATLAIRGAEARAVRAALEAGLKELGLENIQGTPISIWIHKRQIEELQAELIRMEDVNPGIAASVQQRIDDISRIVSGDSQ
jgi:hypothetical protein